MATFLMGMGSEVESCLSTILTLTVRVLSLLLASLARYELVLPVLSPASTAVGDCSQIAVINETQGIEVYNFDGTYYSQVSGKKKFYVYHGHGTLSWFNNGGDDLQSLNPVNVGPQYFCTDHVITFYILAVTLGIFSMFKLSFISLFQQLTSI